jgi:hypothetical protein
MYRAMEIVDVVNIVLACIVGYTAFVVTFYLLSKLIFPKVELDEEYEKLIETYQKNRSKAKARVMNRQMKPDYFKLSRSVKGRVNYT